jgi:hypothetical protein
MNTQERISAVLTQNDLGLLKKEVSLVTKNQTQTIELIRKALTENNSIEAKYASWLQQLEDGCDYLHSLTGRL